jgi:dTDP-4-dehydrorhamnose reductase
MLMPLPRILLIGRIGQVGWELRRVLAPIAQVRCVDFPEIDLTHPDSIRQHVRATQPHVIINAAAYTAVDKAETDFDTAMKVNGVAPGILAEEAKARGAWLVHYSTDYVFDGTKPSSYVETDAPNPIGAYGRTKLAGELAVQQSGVAHLLFRLCWVYGARGHNFLLTILRLAREREKLRVVGDQIGCPTWSRLIAEATGQAIRQVLAAKDPLQFVGTYHLAASGSTSWHGFAEAILRGLPTAERKCAEVEWITTAEYPTAARRPANSVLNCAKLEAAFGLRLPEWEDGLKLASEEMA